MDAALPTACTAGFAGVTAGAEVTGLTAGAGVASLRDDGYRLRAKGCQGGRVGAGLGGQGSSTGLGGLAGCGILGGLDQLGLLDLQLLQDTLSLGSGPLHRQLVRLQLREGGAGLVPGGLGPQLGLGLQGARHPEGVQHIRLVPGDPVQAAQPVQQGSRSLVAGRTDMPKPPVPDS